MKKNQMVRIIVLSLAAFACSLSQVTTQIPQFAQATLDTIETVVNTQPTLPTISTDPAVSPQAAASVQKGSDTNTYWVKNPTSGNRLFVQIVYPSDWNEQALLTLALVPGGVGLINPHQARRLADQGFAVVFFDPDGRGRSQGKEDLGGFIQQDGLAAVIQAATTFSGVNAGQIGLVSLSYGITMASGALSRYPDLPIRFLIDWEGPADRDDTTTGCKTNSRIAWPDCGDQAAWSQREALTFIAKMKIPYQRLQSERDHVQPDVNHAVIMVNAAIKGGVPWVRLNNLPPNQAYDVNNLPTMLPEKSDGNLDLLIGRFARELFSVAY